MRLLFSILFACIFVPLQAQLQAFTQFQNAPLQLNPALTGSKCLGRLTMHTEFWLGGAYDRGYYGNNALSYERSIPVGKDDKIGLGFQVFYSQFGLPDFNTNDQGAQAFFSYQKKMFAGKKTKQYLSFGISSGLIGNGNSINERQNWVGQLNAGLDWKIRSTNANFVQFGASMTNINEPTIGTDETSEMRLTNVVLVYALGSFQINEKIKLLPRLRLQARFPRTITIASNLQFLINSENKQFFELGGGVLKQLGTLLTTTNTNQLLLNMAYQQNDWKISFGTGLDQSVILTSPQTGTFQIGFHYLFCS